MEKVISVSGLGDLSTKQMNEINDYLNKGWNVKSVTTCATKDYVTAIFVLEKENVPSTGNKQIIKNYT